MKKLILLSCICFIAINVSAQLNVSTNLRTDYSWDETNKEWKFKSKNEEALTFFEFNKDFSLVKHTTPTITSAYIIKSYKKDESEGNDQYIFKIMSDVGNKYTMVYDLKNNSLRFIANDGSFMVKHRIKSTWTDK